ncbi:metal-dependent hydrolase [Natronorubrum sp. JWXQ-INN-674]|uniref:Metal-dependent hydrolase n=1 Tax=Natronorubrum halalkaliphilum TaxID=2691917 RepID=A0A6B0VHM4_9EURY|nr:metal-dependent hydrolase [Natronorubrum halalkaliphilum]MXV60994.1 metal-dependent hydrolase [Natronorubrum halalkaliphilum]
MWPLGHAAVAYLCYTVATRARFDAPPAHIPVLVLVFGSQFPDLVDKPLAWYLGVIPTGRTLAHSLLVLAPLSIAVYALASRYGRSEYGIAFAIGALSHSLVDALPALWGDTASAEHLLWPVTPVEPYETGAPSVLQLFQDSLGDPYFLSEFVLAAIAFVLWRRDGYPGLEPFRAALARVRPTPG